jgi:hypothetical protein
MDSTAMDMDWHFWPTSALTITAFAVGAFLQWLGLFPMRAVLG